VEVLSNHIYWTEDNTGFVRRALLDGTHVVRLFPETLTPSNDHPVRLALDPVQGRMYWSTLGTSLVRAANLDGSNATTLPTPASETPYGIAIDAANQQLYWTSSFTKRFYRTDLTTMASELLFTSGSGLPSLFGLAFDPVDSKLYWTDRKGPAIRRANLDGTNLQTIVSGSSGSIFRDIEIDAATRTLLWVDDRYESGGVSLIRRSSLDGANLQTLSSTNSQLNGLAILVPEPQSEGLLVLVASIAAVLVRRNQ
jgi:hypothetical protein